MQEITPFLWFDGNAEEAMEFLRFCLQTLKVGRVTRYGEAGPGPRRTVMSAIPAGWARIRRTQRRPAIQLHAGHLLLRKLRDAARS